MKQPSLFDDTPKVGEVMIQLNRITGRRIRQVTVIAVNDDGTYTVAPRRRSHASRANVTRDLLTERN